MNDPILIWLFGIIAFWIIARRITRRWGATGRAVVKAVCISLTFAPTFLVAGWTSFPAPASLVIIGHFFQKPPYTKGYIENLTMAIFAFVVFLLVTTLICTARSKEKTGKAQEEDPDPNIFPSQ